MNANLPVERDFDPHGCGLDEQCAWRNFGGLTLEEAYSRFESAPEVYQEDFMFMGVNAFVFYYPVIDKFLRNAVTVSEDERDDCQAWILPQCISVHFDGASRQIIRRLRLRVLELCEFMLDNLECFLDDWNPPSDIEKQWRALYEHVQRY